METDDSRFPARQRRASQTAHITARGVPEGGPRERARRNDRQPVLLIIRGEIAQGRDIELATASVGLMDAAQCFPGLAELHGLQRIGLKSHFSIACSFANRRARQAFTASEPYRVWLRIVRRLSPVGP